MDLILIPVVLSIAPSLVAIFILAGRRAYLWLVVLLGGGGWLLALVLRTPLLILIQGADPLFGIIAASVLAGVFEEGARFFLSRLSMVRIDVVKGSVVLGLGWGLVEALLLYVFPVLAYVAINEYYWVDLLPGALERNSAVIVHLSLSVFIARNPWNMSLLVLAVLLHAAFNLVAVATLLVLRNVWLVELVIGLVALAVLGAVAIPSVHYLRRLRAA